MTRSRPLQWYDLALLFLAGGIMPLVIKPYWAALIFSWIAGWLYARLVMAGRRLR